MIGRNLLETLKVRKVLKVWFMIQIIFSMTMVAYAANYAENAAKWGLDQAFWIVVIIAIGVAISAWMKHATGTMIVTILIGGLLAYLCKNPEKVTEIGTALGSKIFGC